MPNLASAFVFEFPKSYTSALTTRSINKEYEAFF